jgi:beta-lactamase class D
MDFNQAFEQQVEHLTKMALQKGWIAYAKQRAQELEDDQSGLWVGLVEAVRERVNERK